MESRDLDMGEIFSDREDDGDIGAEGPLPDLPEATQEDGTEDQENVEALARLKDLSKGAGKKVVRRPQPKLDPSRLTGDRGIPIVPRLFENVKLKGKGHEAQDLGVIMRHLEHWGHRLFPKMPFDEVIERVEKLGSKKEVQTCVKKMRMGMPILNDEFVGSDRDDDDGENVDSAETGAQKTTTAEDMWEELLMEEEELQGSQQSRTTSQHPSSSQGGPSNQPGPSWETSPRPKSPTTPAAIKSQLQSPGGFTPEQLERIEKNKQIAREKRLKKMGIFSPAPTPSLRLSTSDLPSASQSQTLPSQTASSSLSQDNTETSENPSTGADALSHDSDEKSEVIPQGATQNITVDEKNQPDAQAVSDESRLTQESVNSTSELGSGSQGQNVDTDNMITEGEYPDVESVPMDTAEDQTVEENSVDESSSRHVTSVKGEKDDDTEGSQSRDKPEPLKPADNKLTESDSDRNAMSEVIPYQGKTLESSTDVEPMTDYREEEKENVAQIDSKVAKVAKGVDKLPDMAGDNRPVDDEFDDDLTEEQLMETLGS